MWKFPLSRHPFSVNTAFHTAEKQEQELKNMNLRQNSTVANKAYTFLFA